MNTQISTFARFWSIYLVAVLAFASCDNSLPEKGDDSLVIELRVPEPLEVTTKAGTTLNGITITNVWVLQYVDNETAPRVAREYSGAAIGEETNQIIKVTTSGFVKENSTFYVLANTGDNFFAANETTTVTKEQLAQKTKPIIIGDTSEPTFLTAKPISLKKDSIKEDGKAVIVAPLDRAFARVQVQWAKGTGLDEIGQVTMKKIEVINLPKNMAVYTRGGAGISTKYPEVNDTNMQLTAKAILDYTGSSDIWEVGKPQTFYMAENIRGMGDGTSFADKNKIAHGPGKSLDGCTFINISGTFAYKLSSGSYSSPIGIQYKIFLGGNLMNDYNIQRGYSYDLNVYISGANSADVRVTITNGNVAVFDDVQSVTNEIEF